MSSKNNPKEDLTGKIFGKWLVIKYDESKSSQWICQCQCKNKTIKSIRGYLLKSGLSTSCGCNHTDKFIGKTFNQWTVLSYAGDGKYICKCSCGKIKTVKNTALKSGSSRSCGHNNILKGLEDLTGMNFGYWKVLEYDGKHKWKCMCKCGNIRSVEASALKEHRSQSCGCKVKEDNLIKYGDISVRKKDSPRDYWQISVVKDRESFKNYIESIQKFDGITLSELSKTLNITPAQTGRYIHKYQLEYLINYYPTRSEAEIELYNYICEIYNNKVEHNVRDIIDNIELDIYIQEKKLAIEFNGNYWHSSDVKDMNYHQRKTIACGKRGIRLIHIFEYEWENEYMQDKIKHFLKSVFNSNQQALYARSTYINEVDNQIAYDFEDENHLSGSASSSINIGLYTESELVGLMTFGKPRFSNEYQYELIRLCYKQDTFVVGGSEKMFKYFINKYNPKSILSYCNLAKFSGNVYQRLGFKLAERPLTQPNYIWVDFNTNKILRRYETQKKKLIEYGLCTEDITESEAMHNMGYHKIYDSGSFRFEWYNTD